MQTTRPPVANIQESSHRASYSLGVISKLHVEFPVDWMKEGGAKEPL